MEWQLESFFEHQHGLPFFCARGHHQIYADRLVMVDDEGAVRTMVNRNGSGRGGHLLFDRLPALTQHSTDHQIKQSSRQRRRTKRARQLAQIDDIRKPATRIVYYMHEPQMSAHLFNADSQARPSYRV